MSTKKIHIEKYDIGSFEKEGKPYVMIRTDIIQKMLMTHSEEFLLWVFLESLPPTWVPCKSHITKHFDISERTYERYMSWLHRVGLIEYRQTRSASGAFGKGHLIVLDGAKFNLEAAIAGAVKIGGAVVSQKKTEVIHRNDDHRDAKSGGSEKSSTSVASIDIPEISPDRQITGVRLSDAYINTTPTKNKENKKTNNINNPVAVKTPVPVFLDKPTVKTHIERTVANRKNQSPLDDDIVDQGIYYAYESNPDKSFESVNKRINIFLKKVRENNWLIPQGYNDITTQSIRENEEREEQERQAQYRHDGEMFRAVSRAALSPVAEKSLKQMLKMLK